MNVGIIGVSGYTGLELIKCILANPRLNLTYIAATSSGKINEIFPQLSGVLDMDVQVANAKAASECCDLVFLALPHEKAMEFVPQILNLSIYRLIIAYLANFMRKITSYTKIPQI